MAKVTFDFKAARSLAERPSALKYALRHALEEALDELERYAVTPPVKLPEITVAMNEVAAGRREARELLHSLQRAVTRLSLQIDKLSKQMKTNSD